MPISTLPPPPDDLGFGSVRLHFVELTPGNAARGFVPSYHFRILLADGTDAGHLNFRVGDSDHVRLYAGHIGYEVRETHRGHGYAYQACRAVEPFVRRIYSAAVITCDPDNIASRKTIEKLDARFIEEIPVAPHDPHFTRGSKRKLRYEWSA